MPSPLSVTVASPDHSSLETSTSMWSPPWVMGSPLRVRAWTWKVKVPMSVFSGSAPSMTSTSYGERPTGTPLHETSTLWGPVLSGA